MKRTIWTVQLTEDLFMRRAVQPFLRQNCRHFQNINGQRTQLFPVYSRTMLAVPFTWDQMTTNACWTLNKTVKIIFSITHTDTHIHPAGIERIQREEQTRQVSTRLKTVWPPRGTPSTETVRLRIEPPCWLLKQKCKNIFFCYRQW